MEFEIRFIFEFVLKNFTLKEFIFVVDHFKLNDLLNDLLQVLRVKSFI